MANLEAERDGYIVSDDPAKLDLDLVCGFLAGSYWARDTPRETIRRSIENSRAFGLYRGGEQAGFARAVTDYARFAYLADVFVLEAHRGRGLGAWLVECVLHRPSYAVYISGCSPPATRTTSTSDSGLRILTRRSG